MNYYGRFGLEYDPFIKNIRKEVIVKNSSHVEALTRLKLLENIKGFGLLTGNPGVGKTTTIRTWLSDLNPSQYKVIYIAISTITTLEFYRNLSLCFGLEPAFRKIDNYHNIQNQINYLVLEKHITPVIVLDEADALSSSILSDLKIIFNFETDSKDRAIILLTGLPILNNILNRAANESLKQRLVMNYHYELLTKEEASDYIKEKLVAAKGSTDSFTVNAINVITNAASGVMRNINRLCSSCLIIGDNLNVNQIDEEVALKAVSDEELG